MLLKFLFLLSLLMNLFALIFSAIMPLFVLCRFCKWLAHGCAHQFIYIFTSSIHKQITFVQLILTNVMSYAITLTGLLFLMKILPIQLILCLYKLNSVGILRVQWNLVPKQIHSLKSVFLRQKSKTEIRLFIFHWLYLSHNAHIFT